MRQKRQSGKRKNQDIIAIINFNHKLTKSQHLYYLLIVYLLKNIGINIIVVFQKNNNKLVTKIKRERNFFNKKRINPKKKFLEN